MICKKCGQELTEEEKFCSNCGKKVDVTKMNKKEISDEYTYAIKEKKSVVLIRKIQAVIFADIALCAILSGIWILADAGTFPFGLMIGVVIISLFSFLMVSNDLYKGKCPYCKSEISASDEAFDCPFCKRRIMRKEDKFYKI